MELEINDRYSIVLNESPFEFYATRYGERWRELAGDNLVLAMVYQIEKLQTERGYALKQYQRLCSACWRNGLEPHKFIAEEIYREREENNGRHLHTHQNIDR